jgi:hypothetical protein
MAQKYTLVPTTVLEGLRRKEGKAHTTEQHSPKDTAVTTPVLEYSDEERSSTMDELPTLLPKGMQQRGRTLLHYIKSWISLDNDMRVKYADGATGSHLLDLIRYYTSSIESQRMRPKDALKFAVLLRKHGVPESALGRRLVLKRKQQPKSSRETNKTKQRKRDVASFQWQRI